MGKKQREKGKRGERELAELIREFGLEARRGVQFKGGAGSPDVVCEIEGVHIECKRTEALSLYEAMGQAEADAGFKIPVVFHRRSRKPWLAILHATELLALLKQIKTGGKKCEL